MIIGVPKEIKEQEQRVALLPSGTHELTKHGHSVLVETDAGLGSGYSDQDYVKAGAEIPANSLVVGAAFCSGTPAVDRPFMPARTDFYFTTPGLRPVRLALHAARALGRVHRRNLTLAVVYNVLTVSLSYAGLMSPLLCAVVMPATSLSIVLATVASFTSGRPVWRS